MGHYKFYCFPGRVTFFNKKYKGRAGRFYIHAHRDSSGPPPLLKMNAPLTEINLETVITPLQRKLQESDLSETNKTTIYNELEVKKLQLENVVQRQTQGAMIRSKARWHNEGEKNTKYFLNLEKRHFNTKTIRQLQLENSSVIKTDEEILTEAKSFYQNL